MPPSLAVRLGAVNAAGLVSGEGGSVGSVSLGRTSTIIKPIAVPTAAEKTHSASLYTVVPGDTLAAIAQRFGVSSDSIRWSNYDALRSLDRDVSAGQQLVIPPVDGVALTVAPGDTVDSLARRFSAEPQAIIDFNYIRAPQGLTPGDQLVIPGGRGPDFEQPVVVLRPQPVVAISRGATPATTSTITRGGPSAGGAPGNRFDYGYCTWYVASRRPVPWLGDAWQWYGQAQAYHWATGQTPRAGAIMVTWESGWGHVAIVERVNPDGSWLVSEMNFVGWGVVSQRTIRPGTVPLIGFIY